MFSPVTKLSFPEITTLELGSSFVYFTSNEFMIITDKSNRKLHIT